MLIGLALVPYPGPGWLIVFAGLAILSTEFHWARHALQKGRLWYDAWSDWVSRQHIVIRALVWTATALVVIVTIWLLNGYGLLLSFTPFDIPWLRSPLFPA